MTDSDPQSRVLSPNPPPEDVQKGNKKAKHAFKLWPQSMTGQLLIALLLALIFSQIVSLFFFANERSNIAVRTIRRQVLARTAGVVKLLNETDEALHDRIIKTAEGPGVFLRIRDKTTLPLPKKDSDEAILAALLEERAGLKPESVRIGQLRKTQFTRVIRTQPSEKSFNDWQGKRPAKDEILPHVPFSEERENQPSYGRGREGRSSGKGLGARDNHVISKEIILFDMAVAVPLDGGKWLQVRVESPALSVKWGLTFLYSMAAMAIFLMIVVIFAVRKLTAPLRSLERATHKLGRGEAIDALPEEGPQEVRNTIIAFNAMQERLLRFVQDRTRMLAAISHDLRTPITTLRLRAEFIDDEEIREKMLQTLSEMQAMTEAVLAFAREDASNEETKEVDVAALISSLAEDYEELGKNVTYCGEESGIIFPCRPVSLKRALRNLIENALRYAGNAELSVKDARHLLRIIIVDKGPGIPEDKLKEVFLPFFRVEGSRNPETGGVGLGLSITRTIIRSHGGDVILTNRKEGGLMAIVSLPH